MTDEQLFTQEDEVRRGRYAKRLLQEPLMREALAKIREGFTQAFCTIDPRDTDGMVRLRLLIKCLDEFEGYLNDVMTTGQLTNFNIGEAQAEENEREMRSTSEL